MSIFTKMNRMADLSHIPNTSQTKPRLLSQVPGEARLHIVIVGAGLNLMRKFRTFSSSHREGQGAGAGWISEPVNCTMRL